MTRITVRNRQRTVSVNLAALNKFAERALAECLKIPPNKSSIVRNLSEISILLISDRRMAALHQKFLRVAGSTDVITFQHGEIFVSAETARAQSRKFRTSTEKEIQLYIVHGLLHLHGFDDTNSAAAARMERTQQKLLVAIGGK